MINKSRLEALSDAIIAILMTIMALQIEVPTGIKLSSLKNPIIYFIAYIVSFTIAMAFWYNYHCLFAKVTNISKRVFWLNVIWLIMMSLFPMATGWISKYPFATLPQIFYISVYILWCLSYYALQFFLLIDNNVNLNDKEFNVVRLHAKLDIILLILAIAATFFLPVLAIIIVIIQIITWMVYTD